MTVANDYSFWCDLNMLPLHVEWYHNDLSAAKAQLRELEKAKTGFLVLDADEIQAMVTLYAPKDADGWEFYGQCRYWRNSQPNNEEFQLIFRLEHTASQIEVIRRKILAAIEVITDGLPKGVA
ncbi:MAG: hypothetical protein NXI01_08085 [Gammaproteobacteria bacterium]|nr:hypothetical protein [Gammaproteobacteria bacterium]